MQKRRSVKKMYAKEDWSWESRYDTKESVWNTARGTCSDLEGNRRGKRQLMDSGAVILQTPSTMHGYDRSGRSQPYC